MKACLKIEKAFITQPYAVALKMTEIGWSDSHTNHMQNLRSTLESFFPLFNFPRLFSHTINPPMFLQSDVNRRRPVCFGKTNTKWGSQEFSRFPGFPPQIFHVFFPTTASERGGGGMVSCQTDPGILCVSSKYSEDSVRREAGTLKPLWAGQPPTRGVS